MNAVTTIQSQCAFCRHLRPGGVCEAFPQGIPLDVQFNQRDHRQPLPGDHGLTWTPLTPGTKHPLEGSRGGP